MDDLPEATAPVADQDLAPSDTMDLAPCAELPETVLHAEVEETRCPVQPDQEIAHRTQEVQLLYQYLPAH